MRETRRNFLVTFTLAATTVAFAQNKHTGMPKPPPPADPQQKDKNETGPDPQSALRARFQQNEKEFRSGVDRLCQMTESLRDEVRSTHTNEVLSVRMFKRMGEIEKLAKQLKSKAKA